MPSKGKSRLQFTEAEQDGGRLKEHDRAKEREADRAAAKKPPPKGRKKRKRSVNSQKAATEKKKSGQTSAKAESHLRFEDDRPKPPSKLSHADKSAPGLMASSQLHRQISEAEDDNVGVEAAHRLEEGAEGGAHLAAHSRRTRQLREYRATERAEVVALYRQSLRDDPELGSNPVSRWQQKQNIKRQYAEARRASQNAEGTFKTTMERVSDALKGAVEKSKTAGEFIVRHKKGFLIVAGLFLVVVLMLNTMASCSVIAQALLNAGGGSTYPSQDGDMLGAEGGYAGLEADLQNEIDHYAELHPGYDEYNFDLDEIGHDPYVLTSLLTAYHQGEWTESEVQGTLQMLFDRQYILTQTVTTETRYRPELRTRPDGSTYTVSVPYNYYICNVTLENADLSHLPVEFLNEDQLHLYATYTSANGNRPDLFPTDQFPNASQREDYLDYDVPPEALADTRFAAILTEAEKYLGMPYVWGGKNPNTSFDCSGFVSWVINHSGWSVGSRGVMGLEDLCTPVSNPGKAGEERRQRSSADRSGTGGGWCGRCGLSEILQEEGA